jgi:hypothetical protein
VAFFSMKNIYRFRHSWRGRALLTTLPRTL